MSDPRSLRKNPLSGEGIDAWYRESETSDLGIAFFVLKTPRSSVHAFPQPDLIGGPLEFMDWSELPDGMINPKQFNWSAHAFLMTKQRLLVFAVRGPKEATYNWAQNWLNGVSQSEQYKQWTKGAVFLTLDDLKLLNEQQAVAPDEQVIEGNTVDLDDPNVMVDIHNLSDAEKQYIKDQGGLFGDADDPTGAFDEHGKLDLPPGVTVEK